jgi:ESCRT-II complex subunit VPS22
MCANVGVDPLSSNKGMWTQLLGFGDFYYELGVQVLPLPSPPVLSRMSGQGGSWGPTEVSRGLGEKPPL